GSAVGQQIDLQGVMSSQLSLGRFDVRRAFVIVAVACAGSADLSGCRGGGDGGDAAIESGSPRCVTGMVINCGCPGGMLGVQICLSDGTYGACDCSSTRDAAIDSHDDLDATHDVTLETIDEMRADVSLEAADDATVNDVIDAGPV